MSGLIVVGASLAGLRAVEAARRTGYAGPITLVGAENHLPYDRPPLSKGFLTAEVEHEAPTLMSFAELAELDVQLMLGAPAEALDTDNRQLVVDGLCLEYDGLVIATGAHARMVVDTGGLSRVHALRTLDDARAIRKAWDGGAETMVVIGAGFIGSEIASAARGRGIEVTVVEAAPIPLSRAVGERAGELLSSIHEANGTTLICGVGAQRVLGSVSAQGVQLTDGRTLAADLVVVGTGAQPSTGWLAGSGLELDDGVVCDEKLATGVDGVYAAGDVCRWHNPMFGRSMRLEHWTSAAEQGAAAARNALDPEHAVAYETVPFFWSDWYGQRIRFVGVPEADETEVVGSGDRYTVLYRGGDNLVGALTVNKTADIMKYRAKIQAGSDFAAAVDFARGRS